MQTTLLFTVCTVASCINILGITLTMAAGSGEPQLSYDRSAADQTAALSNTNAE